MCLQSQAFDIPRVYRIAAGSVIGIEIHLAGV